MVWADTSKGPERSGRPRSAVTRRLAAVAAVLLLTQAAWAAPLEVYGRLPHLEDFALSPDGARIAFVKTEGNTRIVDVYSVVAHTMLRGMRVGDEKLRYIRWADNDRLMIVTSVTTVPFGFIGENGEWEQLEVFDVRTGKRFGVPQNDQFNGVELLNAIAGRPMVRHIKDHTVLFVPGVQVTNETALALIGFDLDTQNSHVVRVGKPGTLGWVVDETGDVQAEETYSDATIRVAEG